MPRASLGAQVVKNPPAMRETWVLTLSREDPLEKGMATHPRILAWRIPWIEEPAWWAQSPWGRRARHNLATKQQKIILQIQET